MLLGIIEPSSGERRVLGHYAPDRGRAPDRLSAGGARALPVDERARGHRLHGRAARLAAVKAARRRADELLEENGLGEWAKKPIRTLSKGMAQTVQLLGTLVHEPRLIVLDEPFSGLDPINQGKLERLIRNRAADGVTIIFSTHVIAHAERLCEQHRDHRRGQGRLQRPGRRGPRATSARSSACAPARRDGPWRSAFPDTARNEGGEWIFELPESGPEPLLKALIDGGAGIETLAIERPGLHEAFVAIAGDAAAQAMDEREPGQ